MANASKITQKSLGTSREEILQFQSACSSYGLIVIPLVQTFGHLEEIIDQVADLHPHSQWLHVGGDEVYNLKTCESCKMDVRNKSAIFLHHMLPVLRHVSNRNLSAIIWDDMMRDWELPQLSRNDELCNANFPGHEIYKIVCKLSKALHALDMTKETEKGWMLHRQLQSQALSYFRLESARKQSVSCISNMRSVRREAMAELPKIYFNSTVKEWIQDKVNDNIVEATKNHEGCVFKSRRQILFSVFYPGAIIRVR
ncbi:predicted protein [Nematostella vectensis]|uniref:beta-N-acetylhexosaminidase n=1 Tax=Nematostella vectensis TaxID=45351 RepID=A7SR78_NEMVE|nr:predicted protein [Nematostella vectensis]|eukprot:XP_001625897.1 predicted protein [Nematostella vectensis]